MSEWTDPLMINIIFSQTKRACEGDVADFLKQSADSLVRVNTVLKLFRLSTRTFSTVLNMDTYKYICRDKWLCTIIKCIYITLWRKRLTSVSPWQTLGLCDPADVNVLTCLCQLKPRLKQHQQLRYDTVWTSVISDAKVALQHLIWNDTLFCSSAHFSLTHFLSSQLQAAENTRTHPIKTFTFLSRDYHLICTRH